MIELIKKTKFFEIGGITVLILILVFSGLLLFFPVSQDNVNRVVENTVKGALLGEQKQLNLEKIARIEKQLDSLKHEKDSIILHTDNLTYPELQRAIDSLYNR